MPKRCTEHSYLTLHKLTAYPQLADDFPSGVSGILGISFDSDVESEIVNATHRAWGESNTLGHTVLSNSEWFGQLVGVSRPILIPMSSPLTCR